jgi:hypothetical protein
MRNSTVVALCPILLFCLMSRSQADPAECQEAISDYKSAKDDISTALQVYIDCVSNNDGHDDSSSESSTLQSAQEDFEDAVSQYDRNATSPEKPAWSDQLLSRSPLSSRHPHERHL